MSTYFGASSKLPAMTLVFSSLLFRRLRIYTKIITVFTFMKWPGNDHDAPRHDDVPGVEGQWPSGSGAHRRTWQRYLREDELGEGISEKPLILVDRSTCVCGYRVCAKKTCAILIWHPVPVCSRSHALLIWQKSSVTGTRARARLEVNWLLVLARLVTGFTAPPFFACWRGSFWPSLSQSPCFLFFPCDPTAQSSEHSNCPPPCLIPLRKSAISFGKTRQRRAISFGSVGLGFQRGLVLGSSSQGHGLGGERGEIWLCTGKSSSRPLLLPSLL